MSTNYEGFSDSDYDRFRDRFWLLAETSKDYNAQFGMAILSVARHCHKSNKRTIVNPVEITKPMSRLSFPVYNKAILWGEAAGLLNINIIDNEATFTLNIYHEQSLGATDEALSFFQAKPLIKMDKSGFIYLFFSPSLNLYKIGFTQNIQRRLKQLRFFDPLLEYLLHLAGSQSLEKKLHQDYSSKRKHNEWFDLSETEINPLLVIAPPKLTF